MTPTPSPSTIDKMHAGEWYNCMDASLDPLRHCARVAVHHHNTAPVSERGAIGAGAVVTRNVPKTPLRWEIPPARPARKT